VTIERMFFPPALGPRPPRPAHDLPAVVGARREPAVAAQTEEERAVAPSALQSAGRGGADQRLRGDEVHPSRGERGVVASDDFRNGLAGPADSAMSV
jgi:hypothetical protein